MRNFLLAIGLAGLAACTTPEPPSHDDSRIIITRAAAFGVMVATPVVAVLPDGRLRVVVDIRNVSGGDFPLRVQTDWLDATGRPLSTAASRPLHHLLPPDTVTSIDNDAPSNRARSFRMTLDIQG